MVTLIRDLKGGPYNIVLEFIFEFIKEYLGIKEACVIFLPYFSYLMLIEN